MVLTTNLQSDLNITEVMPRLIAIYMPSSKHKASASKWYNWNRNTSRNQATTPLKSLLNKCQDP